MWGLSQREKGDIDPYFTPWPATLCADWYIFVHGIWALCSPVPSLHHTWAEWVQKPARLKPKHGSNPTGHKTCSSCLQQQASARPMEKVCLRKAKKSLWAARTCYVTPDPEDATWGPHFLLQLMFSCVSQWLQVLSLAEYCSFHFLHVSFGFGYILISSSSFTPR